MYGKVDSFRPLLGRESVVASCIMVLKRMDNANEDHNIASIVFPPIMGPPSTLPYLDEVDTCNADIIECIECAAANEIAADAQSRILVARVRFRMCLSKT